MSWSDEFGVFTYVFGVKESIEIIFRVKKVAGNDEIQDGRQNSQRALSASLSRFIIELGEYTWCLLFGF